MFFLNPTPRQLIKIGGSHRLSLKPIPKKWEDFAKLCRIRSGSKIINFNPYPYQVSLNDCIDQNFGTVVVKPRQHGITEAIANRFLHKASLNPAYVGLVLSRTYTDATNVAKRIRGMAESIPEYLRLETENLSDLKILGGGRILFRSSGPNGTRGLESINEILFDELAFVENADQLFSSAVPATETVGEDARLIVVSTPNGKSGFYYDLLMTGNGDHNPLEIIDRIRSGETSPVQYWTDDSGWAKFILHWKAHPKYSLNPDYIRDVQKSKKLPESKVLQEYDLSFTDSETNVFESDLVFRSASGEFRDPDKNGHYFMGLDTSTTGQDFTVLTIGRWEGGKLTIDHLYRNRKHSMEFHLSNIATLIKKYPPRAVGIEVTGGTGQIFLEQLCKLFPSKNFIAIRTGGDTKPAMIDRLSLALESEILSFPISPILDELLAFRRVGKKLQASNGNDDCVMSLAFCVQVSPFKQGKLGFTNINLGE